MAKAFARPSKTIRAEVAGNRTSPSFDWYLLCGEGSLAYPDLEVTDIVIEDAILSSVSTVRSIPTGRTSSTVMTAGTTGGSGFDEASVVFTTTSTEGTLATNSDGSTTYTAPQTAETDLDIPITATATSCGTMVSKTRNIKVLADPPPPPAPVPGQPPPAEIELMCPEGVTPGQRVEFPVPAGLKPSSTDWSEVGDGTITENSDGSATYTAPNLGPFATPIRVTVNVRGDRESDDSVADARCSFNVSRIVVPPREDLPIPPPPVIPEEDRPDYEPPPPPDPVTSTPDPGLSHDGFAIVSGPTSVREGQKVKFRAEVENLRPDFVASVRWRTIIVPHPSSGRRDEDYIDPAPDSGGVPGDTTYFTGVPFEGRPNRLIQIEAHLEVFRRVNPGIPIASGVRSSIRRIIPLQA